MALARSYDNESDIPEEYRELYTEHDGKFVLDVQDDESRKNADDVRRAIAARDQEKAKYAKLAKEYEEMRAKLEGIEIDRLPDAADALKRVDELEHQKLLDEKKFEEAAEKKYQRQLAEMNRQIENLQQTMTSKQQEYEQLMNQHRTVRITDGLRSAFLEQGADPKKLPWIIESEGRRWRLDPENLEPSPVDFVDGGKTEVTALGIDGKPLTMQEHARTFLRENTWAALESHGTGSTHQSNGSGNGFSIRESDARDFSKYQAVRDRAQKAGQEVEIIRD